MAEFDDLSKYIKSADPNALLYSTQTDPDDARTTREAVAAVEAMRAAREKAGDPGILDVFKDSFNEIGFYGKFYGSAISGGANHLWHALVKFDSWQHGCQTIANGFSMIPFAGQAIAIGLETVGAIGESIAHPENAKAAWKECGVNCAIFAVPAGKLLKAGKGLIVKTEATLAKDIFTTAAKEGVTTTITKEAAEKAAKEAVETGMKEMAAKVSQKGLSMLPGAKTMRSLVVAGEKSIAQKEIQAMGKEAAIKIAEEVAKKTGVKISTKAVEEAITGSVKSAIVKSILIRQATVLGVEITERSYHKAKTDGKISADEIANDLREGLKKNGKSFDGMSSLDQEKSLRRAYKHLKNDGIKVVDSTGKEISEDQLVRNTIGHSPILDRTVLEEDLHKAAVNAVGDPKQVDKIRRVENALREKFIGEGSTVITAQELEKRLQKPAIIPDADAVLSFKMPSIKYTEDLRQVVETNARKVWEMQPGEAFDDKQKAKIEKSLGELINDYKKDNFIIKSRAEEEAKGKAEVITGKKTSSINVEIQGLSYAAAIQKAFGGAMPMKPSEIQTGFIPGLGNSFQLSGA